MSRVPSSTKVWLILGLLVAGHLALRLRLAFGPLSHIDGVTIPDDAYLSLNVARNIADGLGPLYGLAPTNGFQPLYVFLAVPLFWWFDDLFRPVQAALVFLSICDAAALVLLLAWLRRLGVRLAGLLVVVAATMFHPYLIETALNGLETSLAFLLLVATFSYADRLTAGPVVAPRRGQAFTLGALLGLALFARIDAVFVGPVILAVLLVRIRMQTIRVERIGPSIGWLLVGGTLTYAPWLVYSYVHTGRIYPISGRAVRHMTLEEVDHAPTFANFYGPFLRNAFGVVWHHQWLLVVAAAIVLGGALLPGVRRRAPELSSRLRAAAAPALLGLVLVLAYALFVFAPWYWKRYFFPAVLPTLLVVGIGADAVWRVLRPRVAAVVCAIAAAAFVVDARFSPSTTDPAMSQFDTIHAGKDWKFGYMRLGLWAAKHFPEGTRIGATQSGGLGYFAPRLTVVNLDGVVNAECFTFVTEGRILDYIRRVRLQFVVGWDANLLLLHKWQRVPAEPLVEHLVDGFAARDGDEPITTFDKPWFVYRVKGN